MTAPIFETVEHAEARGGEPGDFMVVQTPIVGISYTPAAAYELVGCSVICGGFPGSKEGTIERVYRIRRA